VTFSYRRTYRGPIEAVLLDWAGTTMDFGCVAPAVVFVEVFARQGVPITIEEARVPMGAEKRDHIQRITELEPVRARWHAAHRRAPDDTDVSRMYAEFIPLQLRCLSDYSTLIPGTLETVAALRARGIRIGTTSGYDTAMMAINLRDAERQGYVPDATVCASDVPRGRPYPYMCLANLPRLDVSTVEACVKVDDTVPGIEEGLNAGMWTVGFAVSGNEVGLSLADWTALPRDDRARRRARAEQRMRQCGAHYVVDSIADLMPCIDDIQARIDRGERP
jgi:phosphonoacetaldehyde hydrolase